MNAPTSSLATSLAPSRRYADRQPGSIIGCLTHSSHTSIHLHNHPRVPAQFWTENLETLYDKNYVTYCGVIDQMRNVSLYWITHVRDAGATTTWDERLGGVFSYFKYARTCPDKPTEVVYSYIEPLAGPLRHPLSVCYFSQQCPQMWELVLSK